MKTAKPSPDKNEHDFRNWIILSDYISVLEYVNEVSRHLMRKYCGIAVGNWSIFNWFCFHLVVKNIHAVSLIIVGTPKMFLILPRFLYGNDLEKNVYLFYIQWVTLIPEQLQLRWDNLNNSWTLRWNKLLLVLNEREYIKVLITKIRASLMICRWKVRALRVKLHQNSWLH